MASAEMPFYFPELYSIAYSAPQMHAVFRTVNQMGGVLMLHPRDGDWESVRRSTDPVELEEVIRTYPNITFLFHGHSNVLQPLLLPLMSKYPNVYFTYDVIYILVNHGLENFIGQPVMPSLFGPFQADEVEQFLASVERIGVDTTVEWAIKDSSAWFERHPDRIVWGTDLFYWMWDEPASDMFFEIGRRFIGQLPEELQENYAYKNALRAFERYLVPSQ